MRSDITVRHAIRSDADGLRRFLTGLSTRTAYLRFFTGLGTVQDRMLRWLLPRPPGRVVLLAVRGGEIVGHAMYATVAGDAGVADLAVVVADAWQRRGLGRRLVRGLLDTAQAHGVREVRFTVLAGNPGAHRLVAGFAPRRPQVVLDGGVYEYVVPLAVPAAA